MDSGRLAQDLFEKFSEIPSHSTDVICVSTEINLFSTAFLHPCGLRAVDRFGMLVAAATRSREKEIGRGALVKYEFPRAPRLRRA